MTGTRRWPLFLIAAPAAVAIWSGWVGLGELCGFGPVRLLPGITGWTLNTAITLPIGVEAYAAYALGAWMSPGTPARAARFAKWSALGALAYGMAGQVIYHLLAAAHAVAAPWPVVVVVSCMPVAVLGLAAALTHLLRLPPEPQAVPVAVPVAAAGQAQFPSAREIRKRQRCGPETVKKIQAELRAYERGRGGSPHGMHGTAPAASDVPARAAPEVPPSLAGTPGTPAAGSPPAAAGVLIPSSNGRPPSGT